MIGVEEIRIVLMPPICVLPGAVVVVVAILGEPERVHEAPLRMIGVEPHDVVLMPPAGAAPGVITIVSAPSGLSRSAVVARAVIAGAGAILRERRRRDRERENSTRQGDRVAQSLFQFHFHKRQIPRDRSSRADLLKPYVVDLRWSSGTWSKASGRTTVGPDQSRTRIIYRFRRVDSTRLVILFVEMTNASKCNAVLSGTN